MHLQSQVDVDSLAAQNKEKEAQLQLDQEEKWQATLLALSAVLHF